MLLKNVVIFQNKASPEIRKTVLTSNVLSLQKKTCAFLTGALHEIHTHSFFFNPNPKPKPKHKPNPRNSYTFKSRRLSFKVKLLQRKGTLF